MTDPAIGTITWRGCDGCRHTDPDDGDCDVAPEKWLFNLRIEDDTVYCGCYEGREVSDE